jgi:hypothetical protein
MIDFPYEEAIQKLYNVIRNKKLHVKSALVLAFQKTKNSLSLFVAGNIAKPGVLHLIDYFCQSAE